MTVEEKRKILVKALVRELGSASAVKEFSENLRTLNIVDLRDDEQFEKASKHSFGLLTDFIVWQQLGILNAIVKIKNKIQE